MKLDLYEIRNLLAKGKSIFDIELYVTFYARVSTDKEQQLHSLQNQVEYYTKFIKSVPKWHFVMGYCDEGISGKSANKRDEFLRMIDDGLANKFNFIITKELSRFARNTVESLQYTKKLLESNIGILFESDNINTFSPDMDLRLTIMSGIAQDELRKLSERVKFGFKNSIENGIVLGNDVIWGYKKDNGKLKIVENEAEIIRKVFDLYANKGLGIRTISHELEKENILNRNGKPFTFSTLSRMIKNPKYKGYYCGNKTKKIDYMLSTVKELPENEWVIYKDYDKVPPIVSEELWEKANKVYNARSIKQKTNDKNENYQGRYLYSGKIKCAIHKTTYQRSVYKYKSGDKELWQCKIYKDKGKVGCNNFAIYTNELNYIMKDAYNKLIINKNEIIIQMLNMYKDLHKKNDLNINISKYRDKINDILKRKDILLDLILKGRLSDEEFEIRNNNFNMEITEFENKIKILENEKIKSEKINNDISVLREMITEELNFNNGFNVSIIDKLLDRIIVNKSNIENQAILDVYLKIVDKKYTYEINRSKCNSDINLISDKKTSVSSQSCT